MARTKSWTESQQPENQYSWGQYVFNVGAILLFGLLLVALLIWVLWPAPKSVTHVVTIRSDRGELRTIPFQENDFESFTDEFVENSVSELSPFNDRKSFEPNVMKWFSDWTFADNTSLIVVCSAVGAVEENSRPVLKATGTGENIPVEDLIRAAVENSDGLAHCIIVLDCGHDYSVPAAYFRSEFENGDEFTPFVESVEQLVSETTFDGKPYAVITSTSDGELPLYSYNQRRTLFSMALQESLIERHDTVEGLHQSITSYCREHGGEAAQTPQLFVSGEISEEFPILSLTPSKNESEDSDDGEADAPQVEIQLTETASALVEAQEMWERLDKVEQKYRKSSSIIPAEFDTQNWDASLKNLVERSWALRLHGSVGSSRAFLSRFEDPRMERESNELAKERFQIKPEGEASEALSEGEIERRDIARAFRCFHRIKLELKYHLAVFESISWLDKSVYLDDYRRSLSGLADALNKFLPMFDDKKVPIADVEKYRASEKEIEDYASIAMRGLKDLFDDLASRHGCTREMALMIMMDSPLVPATAKKESEKFSKSELVEALKSENDSPVTFFSDKWRISNSGIRKQLHDQVALLFDRPELDLLDQRVNDSVAYLYGAGKSYLPELEILERPVTLSVVARNRNDLHQTSITVEQSPLSTSIDLGLAMNASDGSETQNRVNLECQLPGDAPFKIDVPSGSGVISMLQGGKIRIANSDGRIQLSATSLISDSARKYVLKIRVADDFVGAKFQPIEIMLGLPSEDRIDLKIVLDGEEIKRQGDNVWALRPWPNREMRLEMAATNYLHKARSVRVSLYRCVVPEGHAIMPGAIDQVIKDATLQKLSRGPRAIPLLSRSLPIDLEAGKDGGPSQSKPIVWAAEPEPNLSYDKESPVPNGLLCRIEDTSPESNAKPQHFWLPLFPDTRDCLIKKDLEVVNNQVVLRYAKRDVFKDKKVMVGCWLDRKQILRPVPLTDGSDSLVLFGLDEFKSLNPKPKLLYLDVDGWPRRYAFVETVEQFQDASTVENSSFPNAEFLVSSGEANASWQLLPIPRLSNKQLHTWGYKKQTTDALVGSLLVNCDIKRHFQFPDSTDTLRVKFDNSLEKVFRYPRSIDSRVMPDPESAANLKVSCDVKDHVIAHQAARDSVEIDPILFTFGTREEKLDGQDITRIVFDDKPPEKPFISLERSIVETGKPVNFRVAPIQDSLRGVGVKKNADDRYSFKLWVKPKGKERKKTSFAGEAPYAFAAGAPGQYELSVSVRDYLGNEVFSDVKDLKVNPPQAKPKKKTDKVAKPQPPKTDKLVVTVYAFGKLLEDGQADDLELKISPEPPGLKKENSGAKFTFGGLDKGKKYTVSGKLKVKTPLFPNGIEAAGKRTWEFKPAKLAPNSITKSLILRLERK